MKRIVRILIGLVALAIIGGNAKAQTTKRIQFAKGKSSAVVKDTTGGFGVTYVVAAKSGQKLVLGLTPAAKVGMRVEFDGSYGEMVLLREAKGGHYDIGLEESGDYTIFVGSINNLPVRFSLTVKLSKLTDI